LFGEVNYHAAYEPMRSVRTDRYHYIRRFDGRDRWVLPNIDDTPTKEYLLAQGFAHEPREAEMLYDVVMDPDESNNLVHRPALAHVLGELRTRLERWMRETNDPLLAGNVPAPRGALANRPDGYSPRETPLPIE
ncbi:MAG: sulfatase, partial [Armatimonadota bacterium]|nr:sulfatase [Armatimonadota bacterium]